MQTEPSPKSAPPVFLAPDAGPKSLRRSSGVRCPTVVVNREMMKMARQCTLLAALKMDKKTEKKSRQIRHYEQALREDLPPSDGVRRV